ncbi:hypothetical protein PR048_005021 [Dryococelus australis]|uniref:DUF5641 domain-containing protein n=1 Tax=Dryococelus australis TaxID=614101 RepID=A0ABQ9I717_9NEOP|nr:hypothetical protein PR048_005021 [Dryococelus australis]
MNSQPLAPLYTRFICTNPASFHYWQCIHSHRPYKQKDCPTGNMSSNCHSTSRLSRWSKRVPNLQQDKLVLVKDNNVTPLQWNLAHIRELHPGAAGLVRKATICTSKGTS